MSLIEVVCRDLEAESAKDALAPDPEHRLLPEPQGKVATVEPVGDAAVAFVVMRQLGIEQDDRHAAAVRTAVKTQPRLDPDRPAFDADSHTDIERFEVVGRVPGVQPVDLIAVRTDLLPQVAFAAGERHEHHRQREVCGGAHGIARQHSQAAGVGRDRGVERDFHREVGDAGARDEGV